MCTFGDHSQAAYNTRFRSRSNFARPYICRFKNLRRLISPSTAPLLSGKVSAASRRHSPCPGYFAHPAVFQRENVSGWRKEP